MSEDITVEALESPPSPPIKAPVFGKKKAPYLRGYQSEEALTRASAKPEVDEEVTSGIVAEGEPVYNEESAMAMQVQADLKKMVPVRVTHNPQGGKSVKFQYGRQNVLLEVGKVHLVPVCIRQHLEEKGYI